MTFVVKISNDIKVKKKVFQRFLLVLPNKGTTNDATV